MISYFFKFTLILLFYGHRFKINVMTVAAVKNSAQTVHTKLKSGGSSNKVKHLSMLFFGSLFQCHMQLQKGHLTLAKKF
jgi:hypothetical protein